MGVIDEFVGRYVREYDYYDQAARIAAQLLDSRLQSAGIRAMVTYRAKSVPRLEAKVRDRDARKHYAVVDDIYADIPDLAGVRVALYFPGQKAQVEQIVDELFVLSSRKDFPDGTLAKYTKRFIGYCATHYRARLNASVVSEAQERYSEARIEIQVASVLMQAWAEVEHDLVYKPFQGTLSEDEYAILDELNGLVIAGEIALERLQRAGDVRVASKGRPFDNHYELAAHLLNSLTEIAEPSALQNGLGRTDLLFDLLTKLGLNTPEALDGYLSRLHNDFERRPIAEQIVDQIISEDASRYAVYEEIRDRNAPDSLSGQNSNERSAVGNFLATWIDFERFLRKKASRAGFDDDRAPSIMHLLTSLYPEPNQRQQVDFLRRLRNNVVHGVETPDSSQLNEAATAVRALMKQIDNSQ